jgi:hypothetical protein
VPTAYYVIANFNFVPPVNCPQVRWLMRSPSGRAARPKVCSATSPRMGSLNALGRRWILSKRNE